MAGKRQKAWRNMMVAAINSGIAMGNINLESPDEERARIQSKEQSQSVKWRFELDGIPMLAGASETGYGEIRVTVAAWPNEQAEQSIHSVLSRDKLLDWIGDAYAQGWLECQEGKYLQPSYRPELSCRPGRLNAITDLNVEPQGYWAARSDPEEQQAVLSAGVRRQKRPG